MHEGLIVKELKVETSFFGIDIPSLEVKRGTLTCLVGESGSGKSTFLHALSGFVPSRGKIWSEGKAIQDLPPEARRLALVFQQSALFLKMSVSENLEFPLKIQKVHPTERMRRIRYWLEKMSVAPLAHKSAKEISGGEAQRVQLARALITGFPTLLLDEPLSALDVLLRKELRELLKNLVCETNVAALFVTHDPEDVKALGEEICVMEKGKITFQGSQAQALKSNHPYLKELLS